LFQTKKFKTGAKAANQHHTDATPHLYKNKDSTKIAVINEDVNKAKLIGLNNSKGKPNTDTKYNAKVTFCLSHQLYCRLEHCSVRFKQFTFSIS